MRFDEEKMQGISLIYRYIYKNQLVHRNTLRKQLLANGKIASKAKFTSLLEGLIALDKVKLDKENLFLNPSILEIGILQKEGNAFYVVTPNSKKHFSVDKSVAAGFNSGDILDIVIDYHDNTPVVIVLGKSQKTMQTDFPAKKRKVDKLAQTQTPEPQPQLSKENSMLGRVVKTSHDELVFIPNNKNFPLRQIPILNNREELSSLQNRICVMEVTNLETPLLGGYITEVFGMAGNPMQEIEAVAKFYNSIIDWDAPGLSEEIENIPTEVDVSALSLISEEEAEFSQRGKTVDLRHLPLVTVDPKTCQDMDDAIYSTFDENGDIVVYSAIANITKYLPLDSIMFNEYVMRAFTLYTPNMAYGITPTKLATGICSLNEGEDRLALTIKTIIDGKTGVVKDTKIYDSIIRSRKKYSYEETQEIVDSLGDSISANDIKAKLYRGEELSLEEQILMNQLASETIKKGFDQRRMIRFTSNNERNITLNSDMSSIEDIETRIDLPSEKVIEHFMITANEAVAKYAIDNNLDIIYRIHEQPNPRKTNKAEEFFSMLGIDMVDELSAENTNFILDIFKGTASEELVSNFLIRLQSRAKYSDKLYGDRKVDEDSPYFTPISHYALQSPHYSHFTAGIRRSTDYGTHYNILAHIHGTKPLSKNRLAEIIEIANERQIEIDHAEKDITDIVSVNWCEKHIGETFPGKIFKFRYTTSLDGDSSEILVIVKNHEKGFFVEIPLSQIIGRKALECNISEQGCAIYDTKGNVVLSILKPLDFVIESVDKVGLNIIGKTNRTMVNSAEARAENARNHYYANQNGYANRKKGRVKRFESKKNHVKAMESHSHQNHGKPHQSHEVHHGNQKGEE